MGVDRPAPVGAILLVGVLGMLGWWMLRVDPSSPPPPPPVLAKPTPAPTAPRRTATPRVLFRRPAPEEPTEAPDAAAKETSPKPGTPSDDASRVRSMDDLGDRKPEFIEQGLDNLKQVMEACEEHIEGPLQVMANSKLDSRGLVEMTLSTYQLDEGGGFSASEDQIPPAFSDCLDDVLWEQDWYALGPGEEVPFVLTFNLEQPAMLNEP